MPICRLLSYDGGEDGADLMGTVTLKDGKLSWKAEDEYKGFFDHLMTNEAMLESGKVVTKEDDPEEWFYALPRSYRSHFLFARIAEDEEREDAQPSLKTFQKRKASAAIAPKEPAGPTPRKPPTARLERISARLSKANYERIASLAVDLTGIDTYTEDAEIKATMNTLILRGLSLQFVEIGEEPLNEPAIAELEAQFKRVAEDRAEDRADEREWAEEASLRDIGSSEPI